MKYLFIFLQLVTAIAYAQVNSVGAMSDMGKNNFWPTVYLDSLANKSDLIGLGPLGKMQGEITILDGVPMNAQVQADGSIQVVQSWKIPAPFFVYVAVPEWENIPLNESINNLVELQSMVEQQALKMGYDLKEPFPFKLKGTANQQVIHVVRPRFIEVSGYVEGKKSEKYKLSDTPGDWVGFYSQSAQGVYTHRDSFIHLHFVSTDRTQMGHVDQLQFSNDMILSFPKK